MEDQSTSQCIYDDRKLAGLSQVKNAFSQINSLQKFGEFGHTIGDWLGDSWIPNLLIIYFLVFCVSGVVMAYFWKKHSKYRKVKVQDEVRLIDH